jgi:hypothetical protein
LENVSKEAEREALAARFLTTFNALGITDVAWPNKAFETPTRKTFLVFNIVERGVVRHGIGLNYFKRHFGTVQVDIYVPQDEGTKVSRVLTDAMEAEYETLELPTGDGEMIKFQSPASRSMATNEIRAQNLDDNWDRYMFEAPFYRDQLVEK